MAWHDTTQCVTTWFAWHVIVAAQEQRGWLSGSEPLCRPGAEQREQSHTEFEFEGMSGNTSSLTQEPSSFVPATTECVVHEHEIWQLRQVDARNPSSRVNVNVTLYCRGLKWQTELWHDFVSYALPCPALHCCETACHDMMRYDEASYLLSRILVGSPQVCRRGHQGAEKPSHPLYQLSANRILKQADWTTLERCVQSNDLICSSMFSPAAAGFQVVLILYIYIYII